MRVPIDIGSTRLGRVEHVRGERLNVASRRLADIADRVRGRDSWADSLPFLDERPKVRERPERFGSESRRHEVAVRAEFLRTGDARTDPSRIFDIACLLCTSQLSPPLA